MRFVTWFRVVGQSMKPYVHEGDFVFARKIFPWEEYIEGDVVVVLDPRNQANLLLKRIKGCNNQGCVIEGDNAEASTDSREFGVVSENNILGKVFWRI